MYGRRRGTHSGSRNRPSGFYTHTEAQRTQSFRRGYDLYLRTFASHSRIFALCRRQIKILHLWYIILNTPPPKLEFIINGETADFFLSFTGRYGLRNGVKTDGNRGGNRRVTPCRRKIHRLPAPYFVLLHPTAGGGQVSLQPEADRPPTAR